MKKRLAAVLVLCMLFCMHGVAFAAQSEPVSSQPDLTRDGSITVHLMTVTDEPVLDGSVKLLLVASLLDGPNGMYFEQNAAFGALPFDPIAVLSEKDTAEVLAGIAANNNVPFAIAPFEQGIARFAPVSPGLYLLMQDDSCLESYTKMQPALVLVPELRDGVYLFDADCYPKPVTPRGAIELEITAEKKVESRKGTAPDTTFSFILTPEKPDQPMPKTSKATTDPRTGAAVVTRNGAGSVSFGTLSLGRQDIGKTYRYTMHEVKGTALHFSYDVSVFTITIAVTDNGNGEPKATVTITDENGKSVDRIVFINVYSPPDTPPEIPRTGQLWWPVILLACCGVLLIAIGAGRRARAKRS